MNGGCGNLLTAVIVTYNHRDTIERCIKSVLDQQTTFPFEIQIWDDCSTDGTSEICDEYAKKHPGRIVHIRQEENTFCMSIDKVHGAINLAKIATKYYHLIDSDDYLIDTMFFQSGIDYLENNPQCSIYATRVRCENEITHSVYDWPPMENDDFTVTIDDVGTKRYRFVMTQGRIYRTSERKYVYPFDTANYLYHLTQGYCKCFNRVSAVYSYNGKGIWSNLDSDIQWRINQSLFYRMIQYYGFKHEKNWLRGLRRPERRKIKLLKCLLGTKRAWESWFKRFMVPTFGVESLDRNWNYLSFTWNSRSA